jgi:UDP:flavonoid glycosyltransferase YjiC (YdhE family)
MKILLIPGNNSLSHVAKCAALEMELSARGHTVLTAVTCKHTDFVNRIGLAHTVLPDIQESDDGALPSLAWFKSTELLSFCIQAEMELIKAFKPQRVVGIFRFTLKISAAVLGIPYYAISCGCMMPDATEILGYGPGEKGMESQALFLDNFFRFAGKRLASFMERWNMPPVGDLREMLIGDHTFLWDFPQFMPLPDSDNRYHVGPMLWHGWPDRGAPPEPFPDGGRPLAVISLGSRRNGHKVTDKTARCLMDCGFNVIFACAGTPCVPDRLLNASQMRCWQFAPLGQLLKRSTLLICHGGQMTIFEALLHRVPVLVIPSHPEQAHNGVCVERIKCGLRLAPPIAFKGDPQAYADAFNQQPDSDVKEKIIKAVSHGAVTEGLEQARQHVRRYNAAQTIADLLEEG